MAIITGEMARKLIPEEYRKLEEANKQFGSLSSQGREAMKTYIKRMAALHRDPSLQTRMKALAIPTPKVGTVGVESAHNKASGSGGEEPAPRGNGSTMRSAAVTDMYEKRAALNAKNAEKKRVDAERRTGVKNAVPPGTPGGRWVTVNGRHVYVKD